MHRNVFSKKLSAGARMYQTIPGWLVAACVLGSSHSTLSERLVLVSISGNSYCLCVQHACLSVRECLCGPHRPFVRQSVVFFQEIFSLRADMRNRGHSTYWAHPSIVFLCFMRWSWSSTGLPLANCCSCTMKPSTHQRCLLSCSLLAHIIMFYTQCYYY